MKEDPVMPVSVCDEMDTSRSDMSADFNLNEYIPFLINRSATRVAAAFGAGLKSRGINITVWRLLASLHQHDSQRIGELSEFTGIEMWTVSRVVTRLEQEGLVARSRGDDDGRGVVVSLTPEGEAVVAGLLPEAKRYESVILEGFSQEETSCLKTLLDRLFVNIQR
ncbi:MAG: MarR family transcriptional regulator [Alphaproteobacteria bacterium]|nr:MarR family transcriptional regulator [Alphaproteobacteria bacterium]